ncbi:MAG: acyl carrier protein [Proteobacteria bacterium]|nr:acyl carrier protein [Pseudomonadota bacterium]
MKNQSVENYVFALFATSFPERQAAIARETDLIADLDADSMTMVSLIFSINERFGVSTDHLGDLLLNCRTVGDLISATERLRRECV